MKNKGRTTKNIKLGSSDKRCRVACPKDHIANGLCDCMNRIQDEYSPPVRMTEDKSAKVFAKTMNSIKINH